MTISSIDDLDDLDDQQIMQLEVTDPGGALLTAKALHVVQLTSFGWKTTQKACVVVDHTVMPSTIPQDEFCLSVLSDYIYAFLLSCC